MSCLQREQTEACQGSAVLLQDHLTGALIGLAHAVVGNENPVNEQTHQLVREALLMNIANVDFSTEAVSSLMRRIAEEEYRLVPLCSSRDHPRVRNDDYNMSLMWNAEEGLCSRSTPGRNDPSTNN